MAWRSVKKSQGQLYLYLLGDVLGNGGIAPRILSLVCRWRSVVSFTPRPLYHWAKTLRIDWIGGWVEHPRTVILI